MQLQQDSFVHTVSPIGDAVVVLKFRKTTEFGEFCVETGSELVHTTRHRVEDVSENQSVVVTEGVEVTIWQQVVRPTEGFCDTALNETNDA